MVHKILFLLIPIIKLVISFNDESLVTVHVLFRHGNRTPRGNVSYPKDPHFDQTYEPYGYGQLTTEGKKKAYHLGELIRERYNDFIPQDYSPDILYAISTNVERTKISLLAVLAGLFPPSEHEKFEDFLHWQPISFEIDKNDIITAPQAYCKKYLELYENYIHSEQYRKYMNSKYQFYNLLRKYTGLRVTSTRDVVELYNRLNSQREYGLELPDWADDDFMQELNEEAALYLYDMLSTTRQKQVLPGRLLKKILNQKYSPDMNTKIFLYSAHDLNIGAVLITLGIFNDKWPPFSAAIYFEIHYLYGDFGLKILYEDYSEDSPKVLIIPGCSEICEFDEIKALFPRILSNKRDICM